MAITQLKVHPSIGIARLGNSPQDFFVGPETADFPSIPPGGYKDAQCRILRQGARFRIFAYFDDGTPPQEVTAADADITWRVRLGNKKVATGGASAIIASERSCAGPNQRAVFDDGQFTYPSASPVTVPLGEMRTDVDARLVVLGGFGKSAPVSGSSGWYDDVSDGYVKATVTLHGGGQVFQAVGAWVVVGPPKFAPPVRPPITLYDRLYDYYVSSGVFGLGVPNPIRFRKHIYPILQAARAHRGVLQAAESAHLSMIESLFPLNTAQKSAIVQRLKNAGGDMPRYNGGAELTTVQYTMMERWRDNDPSFTDDWGTNPGPLPLTPDELDRGPLSHCIGAAFFPGIEAGNFLVSATNIYAEAFRLDHGLVSPGDVVSTMALPWQYDFEACGSEWWPAQRPNQVVPQGSTTYLDWTRGISNATDMVNNWHTLGFVVTQGTDLVETERCDSPYVELLTPALNFVNIPQGAGGVATTRALAIDFEIISPSSTVTLAITAGADSGGFGRLTAAPVPTGPTAGTTPAIARLWVTYTTGALGSSATGTATVQHVESGRQWVIDLSGNTVARQTNAVALTLDRSGSMSESRGDGGTKMDSLHDAAALFVDMALQGDGIACVQYNQAVQGQLPVTTLGSDTDPFDNGRTTVKSFTDALTPGGATSIGAGIVAARQLLNATTGFDRKALVVVTDGMENTPPWIADVAADIDSTTFAVGIGRADNVNATTLQTMSGNHGGYLLVTGPITGDNRFILMKYFLQILAGVSNADVVLDPEGSLAIGQTQRVPFQLTDADLMVDVVLLSPYHRIIDFQLESPLGYRITPSTPSAVAGIEHIVSRTGRCYRVRLPVVLQPQRPSQAGTWYAILSLGHGRSGQPVAGGVSTIAPVGEADRIFSAAAQGARQAPYSVIVHTYSDISLLVSLAQHGAEPGADLHLTATLTQFGVPFQGTASAWAEITAPDGTVRQVPLAPGGPGQFAAVATATVPGVYRARVRATGVSRMGWRFQREQTRTAAIVLGGDTPGGVFDPGARAQGERNRALCGLLRCLLTGALSPDLRGKLDRAGFNLGQLEKCLDAYCRALQRLDPAAAAAAAEMSEVDASPAGGAGSGASVGATISPALLQALRQIVQSAGQ